MSSNELIEVINMYVVPKFKNLGECYDICIISGNARFGVVSEFTFRNESIDSLFGIVKRREIEDVLEKLLFLIDNEEHRGNMILVRFVR